MACLNDKVEGLVVAAAIAAAAARVSTKLGPRDSNELKLG